MNLEEEISMPVHSPLYPRPPFVYKKARLVGVMYSCAEENIRKILPEPLEPSAIPMCMAVVLEYPTTSIGPYNESILYVSAIYGDIDGWYVPYIYVTTDAALCSGREIWSFPKKLAKIKMFEEGGVVKGIVERNGVEIIRVSVKTEEPRELPETGALFNLKLIPSVDGPEPALRQLTSVVLNPFKAYNIRGGESSLTFGKSESDPIYKHLPPTEILMGACWNVDFHLPYGKVLK